MLFETKEFPIFSSLAAELDQAFKEHKWLEKFDLKAWFDYWILLMSPKILTLKQENCLGKQEIRLNSSCFKSAIIIPYLGAPLTGNCAEKSWFKKKKYVFQLTAIVIYTDNTVKIIKENISELDLSDKNWNKWFAENLEKATIWSDHTGYNLTSDYYRYKSPLLGLYTEFKTFSCLANVFMKTIAQQLYKEKEKQNISVKLLEMSNLLDNSIIDKKNKLKIAPSSIISNQLINLKEQLEALMKYEEKSAISRAYQEFIHYSPYMALSNCSRVDPCIASVYYKWAIEDKRFIKQRVQATTAYPAIISIVLQRNEYRSAQAVPTIGNPERAEILHAIDNCLELEKILSEIFKVPRTCIRSLQGISYKSIEVSGIGLKFYHSNPESMKNFNYPLGNQLEKQDFWKGYNYLIHTYAMCNISAYESIDYMLSLQSKHKHEKIASAIKHRDVFYNMKHAFINEVVFPAFWQEYLKSNDRIDTESVKLQAYQFLCERKSRMNDVLNKFLVGDKSPVSLLSISSKWFIKRKKHENLFPEEIKWDPLFSEPISIDELKIHCLSNKRELLREGEIMHHCIGTYSSSCLYFGTHILSVKNINEKNIATVALKFTRKGKVGIAQCSGFQNAKVSKKILQTIHQLVEDINQNKVKTDRESLFSTYEDSTVPREMFRTIGFDFTQEHLRNQSFNTWKPYLSQYTSDLTKEIWFEKTELNKWLKERVANFTPTREKVRVGLFARLKTKLFKI